ncbi:MAG TPA: hypothetical protein DCX53_16885 [Anaerolineae bacterium]|nr:hypothetical protein [Anaerolineae bacterium]
MKPFRPLFLLTAFLLVVGLACGVSGGGEVTPAQPVEPQAPVQQSDPPTDVPPPPVDEPAGATYFTEEFDQDPGWDFFLTAGDEDKITVEFDNSLMIFDLQDISIYAYYLYEAQEYDNVRVDIRADNRGKNNNNVSLICRASTQGWYEFSTEGGGLWYLYAVTFNDENKPVYKRLDKGGAQSLKIGKEVNEYGMICEDREITLIVNGKELKTYEDRDRHFDEGYVGFNISSLNVTPIIVEVDWFQVSAP